MKKRIALIIAMVMLLTAFTSCMRVTVEFMSPSEFFNGNDETDAPNNDTDDIGSNEIDNESNTVEDFDTDWDTILTDDILTDNGDNDLPESDEDTDESVSDTEEGIDSEYSSESDWSDNVPEETDDDTNIDNDRETESEDVPGSDEESESISDEESESNSENNSESESEDNSESESEDNSESESEDNSESESEDNSESESEDNSESESGDNSESESEDNSESESEDNSESESESNSEEESESESESETIVSMHPEELLSALGLTEGIMNSSTTCKELIVKDKNKFTSFVGTLESVGYSEIDGLNKIEEAKFTTSMYKGSDYLITIYENESGDEFRIMWELLENNNISLLVPNESTGTGAIEVMQVGTDRENETDNPLNGMCYIIKLADGRAVIIDGGFFNNICYENIFKMLKALDITKDESGKYMIAAWILTHGHGDHIGAMSQFASYYFDEANVQNVIHNLPGDDKVATNEGDIATFDLRTKMAFPDANRVNPHAGLKYYIGNITIEMLYTPELQYSPEGTISYYNDSSLVFKVEGGGKSVLFYGDSAEKTSKIMWEGYESTAFKADILQITHHALYTEAGGGHTWEYLKKVYEATEATYAFLPMQSHYVNDPNGRNGRFTVMIQWCNAGYQISYVMNESDNHGKNNITQDYYNSFVQSVVDETNTKKTLYGYNGINKIVNENGLITYTAGNNVDPMITIFIFENGEIEEGFNVELSVYFDWARV